ncbi:MAG: ribonuclease Z, partial [Proteobacteria bacterium]|nr:ribonuclease Z [Pseudomonadota bacterium]
MDTVKVTILGSGTCVPSLKRSSCSVLMDINDTKLLFDLGAGTMRRLLETGATISQISYLFFSHLHPDHTGEFVTFLFATKYPETCRRRTPFTVTGARGLKDFYDGLREVYGRWIELEDGILNLIELDNTAPDCLSHKAFIAETMPVEHIESSIGFRITTPDGISVVYTGDTDLCDGIVTLAEDADLLICEAALPDGMKVPGHLTPSLAGEIATQANVRRLVLTHFYP